ncbi:hypothetical protein TRIUR3_28603 [Triticum urartu]|uniref:Uncharacterized protein n=1 Tax=Triticum urartu TaxID=4572 RepID=M7ZQN2_TRIUA|nr:hypothetical protein TRIUR3_28603 [Triticum urartu]
MAETKGASGVEVLRGSMVLAVLVTPEGTWRNHSGRKQQSDASGWWNSMGNTTRVYKGKTCGAAPMRVPKGTMPARGRRPATQLRAPRGVAPMGRARDEVRKGGEELGDGDSRNYGWWRSWPWDAKDEVKGEAQGRFGSGIGERV